MEIGMTSIIVGVVVVALIGICVHAIAERKRREAIQQIAEAHNWRFEAKGGDVTGLFESLPLFQKGYGRKARNLLAGPGPDGSDAFWVFEYQFTTGSGKSRNTRRQTVFALNLAIELPQFHLRPEHFFDKIGAAFGYEDINFESYPEFSKRFLLRGESEVAVRALFSDVLIGTLTSQRGYSIEADGRTLLIYRPGKREKPASLVQALEDANGLAREFVAAAESAPARSVIRPARATPTGARKQEPGEAVHSGSRRTRGVSYREVPRANFD